MKRLITILLALTLLCAGCANTNTASSSAAGSSSAETPVTSTPEEEQPEEVQPLAAVTTLTCITPSSVPTFAVLPEGLVFSCWTDFRYDEDFSDETSVSYLDVIDPVADRVLYSTQLEGYVTLQQSTQDGTVLMRNYAKDCYLLADAELNITRLDLPDDDVLLSADGRRYYYAADEQLFSYDPATRESTVIPLEYGFCLYDVDSIAADQDWISCWVYTLYDSSLYRAVLDGQTGELLLLQDGVSSPSFCGDGIQAEYFDYSDTSWVYDNSVTWVWGSLTDGDSLHQIRLDQSDLGEDLSGTIYSIDNSNYLLQYFCSSYYWEGEGDGDSDYLDYEFEETDTSDFVSGSNLYRLTEDGLERSILADYGIEENLLQYTYLSQSDLIVASYYLEEGCPILLLNPSQMSFEPVEAEALDDLPLIDESLTAKSLTVSTPVDLPEVEAYAQTLEEAYGIHILVSGQCAVPCEASGYDVTTTDQSGWEDESQRLMSALSTLEEVLGNYPEGFFRQFTTSFEDSGITFMLIGDIESTSQSGVAAFEFNMETREYIGIDISLFNLETNFYHEIWHATEYIIDQTDYDGLYFDRWDSCNPEDFEYLYSYDLSSADVDVWEYTYFSSSTSIYFVDDYCYTYPKEDRARLMEYIMCGGSIAEDLVDAPALRAKLELMCEGIRYAFDTTGWDTPLWEALL